MVHFPNEFSVLLKRPPAAKIILHRVSRTGCPHITATRVSDHDYDVSTMK